MITRIELTNFMSHEHTVLEPAGGLTVLVGPNNCGKSAVVTALQILCSNDNSTYVTRHGAKECSVEVQTDDGHVVQWRRKKSPSYVIDGTEFSRLQQSGLPDELHQVLRLPKVEAGSEVDFDVHFGTQKDPIFLLRSSSANAAKFFASSSDAIRLVEMQKRHKDKHAQAQRDKNRLEAEAKQVTAELESLEPAVELERRIHAIEQLHAEIQATADGIDEGDRLAANWEVQLKITLRHLTQVESLKSLDSPPVLADAKGLAEVIDELSAAQSSRARSVAYANALAELPAPPQLHETAALADLISRLIETLQQVSRFGKVRACVAALERPPELADTAGVEAAIEQLKTVSGDAVKLKARSAALNPVEPPPELKDETDLERRIQDLLDLTAVVQAGQRRTEALAALTAAPVPSETRWLEDCLARLSHAQRELDTHRTEATTLHNQLQAASETLRRFADDNLCPTCGGPFDADRVLASAVSGGGVHHHG